MSPPQAAAPYRRRYLWRWLGGAAALIGLAVLAYAAVLWCFQARFIYVPQATPPAEAAVALAMGAERLVFPIAGVSQVAWLLPPRPEAPRVLWVLCIGHGGCATMWLQQSSFLVPSLWRRTGAAFVAIDNPGSGENPGSPSPATILAMSQAAQAAALARLGWKRSEVKLAVLGMSLGTGPAAQHAAAEATDRLVLISPYTALIDLAQRTQPWPFWHLLHHRFDVRAGVRAVAARPGGMIQIYHGDADQTIPIAMARELAALAPDAVRLREVPGAGHGDVLTRVLSQAIDDLAAPFPP